jgi:catechol 2,3-dioxygenase-like lactoylglutathione lyase family enzyme
MKDGQIHHVELYVSNLAASIEFWGWLLAILGYDEFQAWPDGKSWIMDGTYITIVQVEEGYEEPVYHRKRVGLNHLAFVVSAEKLKQIKAELQTKGIEILYEKENFDDKVFFEDPDRIKIELANY